MSATMAAPEVHADAAALLRRFNVTVTDVVAVDSDSILFRGFNRMARTAWIGVRRGQVVAVVAENGFNAEPNDWTSAELARKTAVSGDAVRASDVDLPQNSD